MIATVTLCNKTALAKVGGRYRYVGRFYHIGNLVSALFLTVYTVT